MEITQFIRLLQKHQVSFFTDVPDSQLKATLKYCHFEESVSSDLRSRTLSASPAEAMELM